MTAGFTFDNSYAGLGPAFHRPTLPTPVAAPRLLQLNRPLARELGLDPDALGGPEGAAILSGNALPTGAEPIAAAYAGHQFGHFVPQLGDGRAILLGEVVTPAGRRRDVQLKGAGLTAFSRGGDGRAALGPVLREFLVSEAMAALGIATTRSLAVVATGEPVYRETTLPGAVLARVASSHVRVGTFQFFASREDHASLRQLADHVIERHYPEAALAEDPYRALLDGVVGRQAALVARWLQVGFVHGVMNTDNMSVAGETIDYGPCAFLDRYDPATVFSSIDRSGRYAFANQPRVANWNLARLAECLLPLLDPDEDRALEIAQAALSRFPDLFNQSHLAGFRAKIGLQTAGDDDAILVADLLQLMADGGADFTLLFRRLGEAAEDPAADPSIEALLGPAIDYRAWAIRWRGRLAAEPVAPGTRRAAMNRVNPLIIARNHRVEEALLAAHSGDLAPFQRLNDALATPFEDRPEFGDLAAPPLERDESYRTFCGT